MIRAVTRFFSGVIGGRRAESPVQGLGFRRLSSRSSSSSASSTARRTSSVASSIVASSPEDQEMDEVVGEIPVENSEAEGTGSRDEPQIVSGLRSALQEHQEDVQQQAALIRQRWEGEETNNPGAYQTAGLQTLGSSLQQMAGKIEMQQLYLGSTPPISAASYTSGLWDSALAIHEQGDGSAMFLLVLLSLHGPTLASTESVTGYMRGLVDSTVDIEELNEEDEFFLPNLHAVCQEVDEARQNHEESAGLAAFWSHLARAGNEVLSGLVQGSPLGDQSEVLALAEWNKTQLQRLQALSPNTYATTMQVLAGDVFLD